MNAQAVAALLLGFILLFPLHTEIWGADWRPFLETSCNYYYDAANIRKISTGVFRAWQKQDYSPEDIERRKAFGPKYQQLRFGITLFQINCIERKTKRLEETLYRHDGSVLDSAPYEAKGLAFWEYVIPGSIEDKLFDVICERKGYTPGKK